MDKESFIVHHLCLRGSIVVFVLLLFLVVIFCKADVL